MNFNTKKQNIFILDRKIEMVKFLRKLTSCIHRNNISKNIKPLINCSSFKHFSKLSRFELMSDEILIEIFEYIPLIDLFNTFVNLNYRLNYLLRYIHHGIILNEYENIDKYYLNILNYFSKQIYYIHIDYNPLINLKSFSNLHSLIIYLPTKSQLLSINNEIMPNIKYLSIGIINKINENILWTNLFGIKQFIKLNYCNLFQINLNENISLYKTNLNIKKLFITNILTKHFFLLLLLLPNLYQLQISISDVLLTFDKNLIKFSHQNLRILKIEFFENIPKLNKLNKLISFVPNLEECHFIFVNLIKIKHFIILQNIISNKLLKLKLFICSIHYFCHLSSNQMIPKFIRFKTKFSFYQNIQIVPCSIHQEKKCLRKISIKKLIHPISSIDN